MSFLRISQTNALKAATLSAAGAVGGRPVANVLTGIKVEALRVTGTTATVIATFAVPTLVRAVATAATNLTAAGTMSVRLTSDTGGVTQVAATGPVGAAPGGPNTCTTSAEFAYGRHNKFAAWLPDAPVCSRVEVTFSDSTNVNGFLDIGHLWAGDYWQSPIAPAYGMSTAWEFVDDTTQRNGAGDLIAPDVPSFDKCSLTLEMLSPTGRRELYQLLRQAGTDKVLLAIEVENQVEHDTLLYGRVRAGDFSMPFFRASSVQINVEGW